MALTELYKLPKTIERHRQEPLGCFIDGFQEWLKVNQFSLSTMICHISYVTDFSEYLVKQSISHPVNIRSEHIELFSRQYDRQNATSQKIRPALYAVNRFLSYLKTIGITIDDSCDKDKNADILNAYCDWAVQSCNLCSSTLSIWRGCLSRFFLSE